MDFCVKCGKKEVYDESLCSKCYEKEYNMVKENRSRVRKKKTEARHSGYFEAILQLRNPNQKLVSFVETELRKREAKVAKVDEVRGGLDYYLANQKLAQVLGNELQKTFGGVFKITRKLFSVSKITSKKIYRVTVLFRLPKFKVGEVINFKGKEWQVTSIGRQVFLADAETGKKRRVTFKELEKSKLI